MSDFEMTEEEVWDALEELHQDSKIDHVPGIGSDVDPAFTLTDKGIESARHHLKENDEAVLLFVHVVLSEVDRPMDTTALAEALDDVGQHLRDDVGVNVFRVLRRQDVDWFDAEGLPEEFVEVYDP
jgi:hypothetical protein